MIEQNAILAATMMVLLDSKKDSIDLLMPFVKFSVKINVKLNEEIDLNILSKYLTKNFSYDIFPTAVIQEILNRICKQSKYIKKEDHKYIYYMDLEQEYQKFIKNRERSQALIDSIAEGLLLYIEQKMFKKVTKEEAIKKLFYFLEQHGLSETYNSIIKYEENILYHIGKFILYEKEKESLIFNNFVELVKGQLISRAVYMQYYANTPLHTKMQKCKIFLDTSILLNVLELKSEMQNAVTNEFINLLPKNCQLYYFPHTLNEVNSAVRKFMHEKEDGKPHLPHTIELFENEDMSLEDIRIYYGQIEKKLRDKNINEWQNELPEIKSIEVFDELAFKEILKSNLKYSSNTTGDSSQNDVDSAAFIKRIRKGRIIKHLEDCEAIFVTQNSNLARLTKQHICQKEEISFIITEQDFTIAMWLKSSMKKQDIPRNILVSNAMAAIEVASTSFIDEIKKKVDIFIKKGDFVDDESIQLMIEDKNIRQEVLDEINGDIDLLTPEILKNKDKTYKEKIAKDYESEQISKLTFKILTFTNTAKDNAKKKATKAKRNITIWLIMIVVVIASSFFGLGMYFTVAGILSSNFGLLGTIVMAFFGVYSLIDLLFLTKRKKLTKFITVLGNRMYDKIYDKEIKILEDNNKN